MKKINFILVLYFIILYHCSNKQESLLIESIQSKEILQKAQNIFKKRKYDNVIDFILSKKKIIHIS